MPKDNEPIVIDLEKRPGTVYVDNTGLIQRSAAREFGRLLKLAVNNAPDNPPGSGRLGFTGIVERTNTAVVLNGGRGSGKTTLLNSILTSLQSRDPSIFSGEIDASVLQSVMVLGIIDPALAEPKEHTFVNIVSLVKQAVEANTDPLHPLARDRGHARQAESTTDDRPDSSYSTVWRETLNELAVGLTLLDGVGKAALHDDWDDALYVAEIGLDKAKNRDAFEEAFRNYLYYSLKILRKRLFVIAFDDIDTAFQQGWLVLEIIRKYLANPWLMVVVSGDLNLYTTIVRQRQVLDFNEKFLAHEQGCDRNHEGDINDLEDQYMMKVFPPSGRIDLARLSQVVRPDEQNVLVKHASKPAGEEIGALLNEAIAKYYSVKGRDLPLYRSVILRQPTRSVVQFLDAFTVTSVLGGRSTPNRIAEIVIGALDRCGVKIAELQVADDQDCLDILRRMLQRERLWKAGFRLRPDHTNDDHNMAILALSSRITPSIAQNPILVFDYWIKICLPHEASQFIQTNMSSYLEFVSRNLREDSFTEACQHVAVISQLERKRVGAFASRRGVIRVLGPRSTDQAGYLDLITYGGDSDRTLRIFVQETTDQQPNTPFNFTEVTQAHFGAGKTHNNWRGLRRRLGVNHSSNVMGQILNLIASEVVDERGQGTIYCSIFTLLGAISYLLGADRTTGRDIADALKLASNLRSFASPNWETDGITEESAQGGSHSDDSSDVDEDVNVADSSEINTSASEATIVTALYNWRADAAVTFRGNAASMQSFARAWSRFYYTVVRVDESDPKDKFLGWLMHRYIIAFLNAVLVEEIVDRGSRISYTHDNPSTEDKNFFTNLGNAAGLSSGGHLDTLRSTLKDSCPVFEAIFSCPIWACFLDPTAKMQKVYGEKNLLELQISLWNEWAGGNATTDRAAEALKVTYALSAKNTKTFVNLFHPLNSVLIPRSPSVTRRQSAAARKPTVTTQPDEAATATKEGSK